MIDLDLGWLWAIGAGVVALAAAWWRGRRSGAEKAENKGLRDYRDTRKAIDDVEDVGDDPATLRDWLRERGKRPGDL